MARRRKRRVSPRFYMFVVILLAVAVGVVLIVKKLQEPDQEELDANATPTPYMTATPTVTNTPKPALPSDVAVVRAESANPSSYGFSTAIQNDRKSVDSFSRAEAIFFGRDTEYTQIPGILTFGGNNYRNSFSYGTAAISTKRLSATWEKPIGGIDSWTGTGWTGQPLMIQWPAETRAVLGISADYKTKENFVEVIYPAMDGNIYFFDLDTGKQSRNPIPTGVVNKGTACLDPRGYPLLFVGQGIPVSNDAGNGQSYVRCYSLITNELLCQFGGYDYFSDRDWQAYDGSPMIVSDTLVYAGENGVLYTSKLNAQFDAAAGTVSVSPEALTKYKYSASGYSTKNDKGARWYGTESSVSAFRNYLFMTDNGGRLQCVDVNTMKLKYVTDLTDETDSTPVLEESYDDNTVYLYTGSQVGKSDPSLGEGYGYTYLRKINALTGSVVWEKSWICSIGDDTSSGGTVATPVLGKGNIESLVIYAISQTAIGLNTPASATATVDPNVSATDDAAAQSSPAQPEESAADGTASTAAGSDGYQIGGRIVAYNKTTGEVQWTLETSADYWSSPVLVYDTNYRAYLLLCDRNGHMKLYDAADSTLYYDLDLGSRIDSTPSVFGNMIVVGTRGKGGSGQAAKIVMIKIN